MEDRKMILDTTKDLNALFSRQVIATPEAIALEDEKTTYTYAELDREVEKLSLRLRRYGVVRDSLVGVLLPRSPDYVIACLAALRAGGAFLVLELAYPPDLLADVIEDANPAVVVTYRAEVGKIREGIQTLVLDDSTPSNGQTTNENTSNGVEKNGDGHDNVHNDSDLPPLPAEDDLERLAFVSYSSGTTGKPKGIANPHRAPVLSYDLRFAVSDLQPGDRVACNVFFIWEIIRPLLRGATVVTVPDEVSYDPVTLVQLLADKNVTETLMTPTLLAAVLSRHNKLGDQVPKLRTLWLNGEVVTADLARRALKTMPQIRLLNVYSACETHEVACGDIKEMLTDDATYCPVGPPLDPKRVYILDTSGQRAEDGTSGELFVGGRLLARGYLNRPETTARAFLSNPYDSRGGVMYRTGDLARILPNGLLEITGRVGAMIKLRGYSVVPGKVVNAINMHLAIKSSAVIAHGDGLDRQLVAYVVRDQEESDDRPRIEINDSGHSPTARKALAPYLAQYMIPTRWIELDVLPTHEVSGKVDLKRLPSPDPGTPRPAKDVKQKQDTIRLEDIAETWAATLNVSTSSITPEHSFFDLGGHSLSLAALASRMSRSFGLQIPVARLADPASLNGHLQTVRAVRDGQVAAVQADLPGTLRADSVLDKEISPPKSEMCAVKDAKAIFLTGATGFLGAFVLNELLENTSAQIICLVRFKEPSEEYVPAGIARLRRNLIDYGLWRDGIMERIEVLPGNLERKRIGLSHDGFAALGARVQVIVHAAATVNLIYPYATLRGANVGGTREILRLASIKGATVQHISTNGVLPPSASGFGWPEDAMLYVDSVPHKIPDGYGQTKWVAEQLVLEAGRRGLPVRILRAGTISGHSLTGASNPWDLLTALFVESICMGYAPDVTGWRAEMTPVDFVARAIVHLANQTHAKQLTFHLGDPQPVDTKSVFEFLAAIGYETKSVDWDRWVSLWNEKRGGLKGGDGAFTIDILRSGMPEVGFLRDIVVLNNAETRPFRLTVERPQVSPILMETYARHWFARGWLLKAPTQNLARGGSAFNTQRSILSGRVAVITGASSGIGAAVAHALAQEGCHLALAARRTDALESLKRRLVSRDGKVIVRGTDVTSRSQMEDLMKATTAELGPIDILVSCAGVMYWTLMANANVEEWERTVDVNCKGLLNCLSTTVPGMLEREKGHIVAISSDAGRKVFPGLGVYSASKFFVEATLQALRVETAGKGLRVTSIQPGNTNTDLLGMSTDTEAVKKYGEPSGAQIMDPDDVARAIVYALKQPEHVAVNEILIEPRDEPI